MTLDEAMDGGHEVSAKEAKIEIERHGCNWAEFCVEYGTKDVYPSVLVMTWLGY